MRRPPKILDTEENCNTIGARQRKGRGHVTRARKAGCPVGRGTPHGGRGGCPRVAGSRGGYQEALPGHLGGSVAKGLPSAWVMIPGS